MAIVKKAPMFLDKQGSIGTCKFYKDSVEIDKDFIYFAKAGKLAGPKIRQDEKFKKDKVAKDHTFIIPGGSEHHKFDRSGILGMCNLRPICAKDMSFILDKLRDERDDLLRDNIKLKGNIRKLVEEIKKEQSNNPILIAHAEGIAQSL